jgi:hypothetical protein
MGTAQLWGMWAADRGAWQEAAEAGGCGLEAMTRLFRTQLVREHKEAWLQAAIGLPTHAAYALARSGDAKAAAVALERGRALLLSEVLERDRADASRLADLGHAGLVRRYRLAADRLTELERADRPDEPAPRMTPAQHVEALREVRAELDAAVAEIRTVTGYAAGKTRTWMPSGPTTPTWSRESLCCSPQRCGRCGGFPEGPGAAGGHSPTNEAAVLGLVGRVVPPPGVV